MTLASPDPNVEKETRRKERDEEVETLSQARNQDLPKYTDRYPELKDFYNQYDALDVTDLDRKNYREFLDKLNESERKLLEETRHFYVVDLANRGGLVMPVVLAIEFDDDTRQELRIPAEIWRRNNRKVAKLFITDKTVRTITLDPHLEFADVDRANNRWPPEVVKSRFQLFKEKKRKNPMQPGREGRRRSRRGDDE